MTIMGSVDISFTNSTKIAKGAEQTAGNAQQTANTAQETANGAAQTAGQAQATAETATQTATQAASTANSAQQTADTALQSANGKNTNYYGPDEPASGKDGDLWFKDNGDGTKTVYQYINNAWSLYIDQNASDAAQAAADAQSAADNAAQLGSAAQSTANAAAEAAATAQQAADDAASAASNAQVSADSAQEAAENAQATASSAADAAADAKTAANNAADVASAAQTIANNAKSIGQAAQTAADNAVKVATAAQTTANDAKQQAANAVNSASTATQNAQDAISQAQTAFDNAQDALAATDSLASRMTDAEGNISALQQTSDSFATRISDAEGNITTLTQTTNGLQTTVAGKVDTTTYNSFVTQTNSALQSKLSIQDAANTYATQSSLTQTANSLTSKITSVQTNLDNLQIGGRNFLLGTSTPQTVKGTGGTNQCTTIYYLSTDFSNLVGKQLTISFDLIADTTSGTVTVQWNNTPWGINNFGAPSTTLKHYTRTFTLSGSGTATGIQIRLDNLTGNVTVSNFMLEISSKPSSWQPAPEDLATQSQISQLSDDINLRVQKNDVINQINVSTESILISGNKIHITGQTTIDNAVITSAMIKSVSASTITTGTLDASVVNVTKLNASNITTGTLSTNLLSAGSIDATKIKAGTLSTASGVFGDISASSITSGTLSANRIGANSITTDKLLISDFTNLCQNPGFEYGSTGWNTPGTVETLQAPHSGSKALHVIGNGSIRDTNSSSIVCQGGDQFYAECYVKTTSTGLVGTVQLAATISGSGMTTSFPVFQSVSASSITASWLKLSGTITIPSGYTSMYLRLSLRQDVTSGDFYFDDVILRRMSGGELIVDGAITGTKIAANTIDASNIKAGTLTSASGVFGAISANNITTGTLNAANVTVTNLNASNISTGTLNVARIGAGTIDATKLSVSTLSAISANLGSVTAGTLTGVTINAGTFNSSGDRGSLTISQDSITTTKTTVSGSTTTVNHIETFGGSMLFDTQVNSTVIDETLINAGSIVVTALGSTIINGNTITTTNISAANITSNITFNGTVNLTYGSSEVSALVSSGQIQSVSFWSTGASTFNQILTGNLSASRGGAINLNNGDIIGANGIYLNDAADVDGEGIVFPWSTSTNVLDVTQADCLRAYNGRLLLNGDVVHTEKSMMIATGYVVITPSAANTPTYKTISFGKTFPVVPTVVVTPNSTVAGTTVTGWAVTDVTTTNCKIWVTRGNTTDTGIQWIAIADNTAWTANAVG